MKVQGGKQWAQGALACAAGRSKEMRRSWISKRKSWFYNCEESLRSQICRKVWETCSKKNGSRSCKISSKDGIITCQSIKRCRRDRNSCRVHRSERSSARRTWASGRKTMSVSGMSSKTRMQRWKITANKSKKNPWPKRSWKRKSEACKPERRGSSASQYNGCCMGPTFLQSFLTPGAGSSLCFSKTSSARRMRRSISQCQSPQCISGRQEKKMRRSRGNLRAVNLTAGARGSQ